MSPVVSVSQLSPCVVQADVPAPPLEEENQFQQITAARKYIAEQALKQQNKKVRSRSSCSMQNSFRLHFDVCAHSCRVHFLRPSSCVTKCVGLTAVQQQQSVVTEMAGSAISCCLAAMKQARQACLDNGHEAQSVRQ